MDAEHAGAPDVYLILSFLLLMIETSAGVCPPSMYSSNGDQRNCCCVGGRNVVVCRAATTAIHRLCFRLSCVLSLCRLFIAFVLAVFFLFSILVFFILCSLFLPSVAASLRVRHPVSFRFLCLRMIESTCKAKSQESPLLPSFGICAQGGKGAGRS